MAATISLWQVVGDPTRRSLLEGLRRGGPSSVGELVERVGLAQPAVSKHLRVLRRAGLVRVRRDAQRRIYELEAAPLSELDQWLAPYRTLWNERLDALGSHLDTYPTNDT